MASCQTKSKLPPLPEMSVRAGVIDTAAFLNLFAELPSDSVYFNTGHDILRTAHSFVWGQPIPQIYSSLFANLASCDNIPYFGSDSNTTFAVCKFRSGDNIAFVLRHGGYYDASRITLFFYNTTTGVIDTTRYWLAEAFGDAGDYFLMQAGLKKQQDGSFTISIYKQQNCPVKDTSSYDYINTDSTFVYSLQNSMLTLLSASEDTSWIDTPMP